jgi:hypothetical protein
LVDLKAEPLAGQTVALSAAPMVLWKVGSTEQRKVELTAASRGNLSAESLAAQLAVLTVQMWAVRSVA